MFPAIIFLFLITVYSYQYMLVTGGCMSFVLAWLQTKTSLLLKKALKFYLRM